MGFPMVDQPTTDISRYFYIASKFIENGINSGGEFRPLFSWQVFSNEAMIIPQAKSSCTA